MKNKKIIICGILIFLLAGPVTALTLSDVFTLTLNVTNISACINLSDEGVTYELNQTINGTGFLQCINITADNIILDCRGFQIYSNNTSGTTGIYAQNRENITIKNCVVEYFNNQIYLQDTNNSRLENNNATSYKQYGIYLVNSSFNRLYNNYAFSDSSDGIHLLDSSNNNLSNNTGTSNSDDGIVLDLSDNNILVENAGICNLGFTIGISISASSNNILTRNYGLCTAGYGISLTAAMNNNFTNNTGSSDASYGIILSNSSNNSFNGDTGVGNFSRGVYLLLSPSNIFNETNASGSYGFYIQASGKNNITNSLITGSTNDIYVHADAGSNGIWFINCSFNQSNIDVNGASNNITVAHFIRANVTNFTGGSPLQNSNVSATDSSDVLVFSELTDASGLTPWRIGREYVEGTDTTYYINYTVNASLVNYVNASVSWDISLDDSVDVIMMIIDTVQPHITPHEPENDTSVSGDVLFIGYVSDNVGVSNVSLYLNGTINQTNISGIRNINYSFTANNLAVGDWTWYYRACDYTAPANCNNSVTRTFTLVTTTTTTSTTTTTKKKSGGGGGGGGGVSVVRSESCFDGLLNQDEEGIDCGGPCQPCVSCSDGIQNQGETEIDCGGPCPPCETTTTTSTSTTETTQANNSITSTSSITTSTIKTSITPLSTATTLAEEPSEDIGIEYVVIPALIILLVVSFYLIRARTK